MSETRITRREVIKKAAYAAPMIVTTGASFLASAGSGDYDSDTREKENNTPSKTEKNSTSSFLDLTNKTRLK